MSGFSAVGLYNPKNPLNVGEALRACGCYGAAMIAVSGIRYRRACTDTQAAHRHIPLIECDDLRNVIPFGASVVAVDLIDGATPLAGFKHPKSAFYIFGPEDGTLNISWADEIVYIPTKYCMNLAATVNVVLYDRQAKGLGKSF